MSMQTYVEIIQEVFGGSKEAAKTKTRELFDQMAEKLASNGELQLPGIGTLKVTMTAIRDSYFNVHTGQVVNEPSGGNPTVKFKASNGIKEFLAEKVKK